MPKRTNRAWVDEPGRAGHSGAGQEEFPDVPHLDAVGNVFTGKVKVRAP